MTYRITPFYQSTFICELKFNLHNKKHSEYTFTCSGIKTTLNTVKNLIESFGFFSDLIQEMTQENKWVKKTPITELVDLEDSSVSYNFLCQLFRLEVTRVLSIHKQQESKEFKYLISPGKTHSFCLTELQPNRKFINTVCCIRADGTYYYVSVICLQNEARETLLNLRSLVVDKENEILVWKNVPFVACYETDR